MKPRLAALFAAVFLLLATRAASAAEVVSIATGAPKNSLWGQVFGVWQEAITKKSNGALELQIFYNGSQGDDATVIGKLKAGQLDAAAVSSVGLSQIYKPIMALQIPGLFRSWDALDRARDAVQSDLSAGAEAAGFVVTLGDLGKLRTFTMGFEVRRPSDFNGKKVASWRNDLIGPAFYQSMDKQPTLVPLSLSEVLPALRTKSIDALGAPTLAAEQLQWTPYFDHMTKGSLVMVMGGMAFSKKRLDSLPGDLRKMLTDTGAVVQATLRKKVRAEDEAAFDRLSDKMTVVDLSDDEKKAWRPVFEKAISKLKQDTFDAALVDKLVDLAKE
ncbi:MAG: TRAP transporter substrate-binding protein DctP [Polyangiaceae bacterium]